MNATYNQLPLVSFQKITLTDNRILIEKKKNTTAKINEPIKVLKRAIESREQKK